MKYIVIRNQKSDKLTMHSTACSVVAKHFSKLTAAKIEAFGSDTQAEALETVEFHGGKTKICNCAKV